VKASEVRSLLDEELIDKAAQLRRELYNLRFQRSTGQLANTARFGGAKRDLARVLTVMRDRDIGEHHSS